MMKRIDANFGRQIIAGVKCTHYQSYVGHPPVSPFYKGDFYVHAIIDTEGSLCI